MHKILSISKDEKIGDKAKNLIYLDNNNLTPNFIVLSNNYIKILIDNNKDKKTQVLDSLKKLNIKNPIIRSSVIGEDSSELSYAGIFESKIVKDKNIFEYISKVYKSIDNPKVKAYDKKKTLQKNNMSIIIQEYIKPDLSGVCLIEDNNPLIEFSNKIDAVVNGTTNPYAIYRYKGYILYTHRKCENILLKTQNIKNLFKKIDRFKFNNCDIEFIFRKNKLYLVQIRPLTKKININYDFVFRDIKNKNINIQDIDSEIANKEIKKIGYTQKIKIIKDNNHIKINFSEYKKIIDYLIEFSKDRNKLNNYFNIIINFHKKNIKNSKIDKSLKENILMIKEYYLELAFYDKIINMNIQLLSWKIKDKKEFKNAFEPEKLSISCKKLLEYLKDNKKNVNVLHDYSPLKELNFKELDKLTKLLEKNKIKSNNNSDEIINLKKLVWYHDANDYYVEIITKNINDKIKSNLINNNVCYNIEINDICKMPFKDIKNLTINEIINNISTFKVKNKIEKKSNLYNNHIFPLKGINVVDKNITGIAKIIKRRNELYKIDKESILITQNTHPSFLPHMILSKGIITELGGLASHAAIVCRELEKPCIVGVQGCMDIIKDGDLISIKDNKVEKIKNKRTKTVIFLGYACNNKCIFCCNEDKRNLKYEKSFKEIKKDIKNAFNKGSSYLELIGGEPTIRTDLIKIIKYAKKIGFKEIMFATNGRMLSVKKYAEKIIKSGVDHIIFSIHGHNEDIHDSLTQCKGSFSQMIKGIKNVKELGFTNIGSNTTIVKQNYKHLIEIGNLIKSLNIENAEFIYVDPNAGGAKKKFKEIVPTVEEIEPFVNRLLEIGKNIRHWHIRYYPLCHINKKYHNQISEINENKNFHTIHIAPDFKNENVAESRKNIGKSKINKCINCKYDKLCEGYWKEYLIQNNLS